MNVIVFGLGHVGCVTAACLARGGHRVVGVDGDADKVSTINAGQSPIAEPGLCELIASTRASGRLGATDEPAEALRDAHVALICVGTSSLPHGRTHVEAIDQIGQEIGRSLGPRGEALTVVLRSTVLPGTTERVLEPALRAGVGGPLAGRIRLAVNPEFMREGSSLADFDEPPMILAGSSDPAATVLVRTIYHGVRAPFVQTSIRTAELVKVAATADRSLKVCFAREIADLAQAVGAARADDVDGPGLRSVLPSDEAQIPSAIDRLAARWARRRSPARDRP